MTLDLICARCECSPENTLKYVTYTRTLGLIWAHCDCSLVFEMCITDTSLTLSDLNLFKEIIKKET